MDWGLRDCKKVWKQVIISISIMLRFGTQIAKVKKQLGQSPDLEAPYSFTGEGEACPFPSFELCCPPPPPTIKSWLCQRQLRPMVLEFRPLHFLYQVRSWQHPYRALPRSFAGYGPKVFAAAYLPGQLDGHWLIR